MKSTFVYIPFIKFNFDEKLKFVVFNGDVNSTKRLAIFKALRERLEGNRKSSSCGNLYFSRYTGNICCEVGNAVLYENIQSF